MNLRQRLLLTSLLSAALLLAAFASPAALYTVSNTSDSGAGSFRQAILDANANPGADTITFQIPGTGVHTLAPASAYPPLLDPVVIDGTTQAGYAGTPLIELNGTSAGNSAGMRVLAGNCTIQGLAINNFGGSGIQLEAPGSNTIRACFLGTDPSGTIARPNTLEGVWIHSSSWNTVGGTTTSSRNVISGNADSGIYVQNGSGNSIQANFIGVTASGTAPLANANNGITLYYTSTNQVGGSTAGKRNIISGNRGSGVYLTGSSTTANSIQGNFIGTGVGGIGIVSNAGDGITVDGAATNTIGGVNPGEGNVISGNGKAGVFLNGTAASGNRLEGNLIGTDMTGKSALGNTYAGVSLYFAVSNWIGSKTAAGRNVISGNRQDGIFLSTNSTGNTVLGNFLGVDITGSNAVPNLFNGLTLSAANSNLIGGSVFTGNLISGNTYYGIQVANGSTGNSVQGNFIGPDINGTRALRNGQCGVRLESAANQVGGPGASFANVISGNALDGVMIVGVAASNNVVAGNTVGLAADGTTALGNGRAGIGLSAAPRNTIGGAAANIIAANGDAGIYLETSASTGNQILGNRIGTDQGGTIARGNTYEGIYLDGAQGNIIGSAAAGAGNLISGNHTRGIFLTNASWNLIQGNLIGTALDGVSPLGNTFHNIECEAGADGNVIGGPGTAANTIAYAQTVYAGVRIRDGSTNNFINGNSIFGNGALGIDLGVFGTTANDACDTDTGANQLQNFPVLTQAVSGNNTGVRGTLNSAPSTSFRLQFFANPSCDPSGYGEGQLYLGQTTVMTGAGCSASFVAKLPVTVPPGWAITATAIDPANNTSEFSACVQVAAVPRLTLSLAGGHTTLSWPSSATGFVLKQTASLSPPVQWTTVTNAVSSTGGQFVVSLTPSPGNWFYTLSFE